MEKWSAQGIWLKVTKAIRKTTANYYTLFELKNDGVRARQEYLEAVKVEPFFHVSHLKLADIYIKEGNVQDAIAELEFVMRINPDESVRMTLDRLKNR